MIMVDNRTMKDYSHPRLENISLPMVLQALADPCRLKIVRELLKAKGGELACSEVPLDVAKATRSHHFDVLREAGVIQARPEGTKCMTSVRKRELARRFPGLLKLILAERAA